MLNYSMIDPTLIQELKNFNWQVIIDYGNSLTDLNDAQLRFAKGLAVELAVEDHCNGKMIYVGEPHRDYHWPARKINVELKSIMSQTLYGKNGRLKKPPLIRLSNSMGGNSKKTLDPNDVADIIIAVLTDGAYVIDKATAIANARHRDDGWTVHINKDQVIELSGRIESSTRYHTNLAEKIRDAIRDTIPAGK